MDAERVDLLIQYALAIAAQNDWGNRELGPIHLLKYVYLGDLAYAERNNGSTFTGADWRFYKFGPWANAVHERIPQAVGRLRVEERRFAYERDDGDGEGVRWRLADEPNRVIADLERKLPGVVTTRVRRNVREFAGNTSDLLHFVYRSEPMLHAAPDERLSFEHAVPEPPPQFEQPTELTDLQRKKLRTGMRALRERLAGQPRPRYVKPDPEPIYDEIFEEGVKALDQDAGDEFAVSSGEVQFSDEMWKAGGRRGGGIP